MRVNEALAADLAQIRSRDGVDIVLVLKNTKYNLWHESTVIEEGIGLFTRCQLFVGCRAEAFDYVSVYLYDTAAPRLVSSAKPTKGADVTTAQVLFGWGVERSGTKISDIDISGDLNTLSDREIDKAKEPVMEILSERTVAVMRDGGL